MSVLERTGRWLTNHVKSPYLYSLQRRFTEVYSAGAWIDPRHGGPRSGPGSTIENTGGVRARLLATAKRRFAGKSAIRIVDAPCGDMTWMPLLLADLAEAFDRVDYVGIDIVAPLVAAHRCLPPIAPNLSWRFERRDITRDPIPTADLFFCKDLVNHLAHRDIARLLANVRASGSAYALFTSNRGAANEELAFRGLGASRALDLQAPPFNWPAPVEDDGYLALWKLPAAESAGDGGFPPEADLG